MLLVQTALLQKPNFSTHRLKSALTPFCTIFLFFLQYRKDYLDIRGNSVKYKDTSWIPGGIGQSWEVVEKTAGAEVKNVIQVKTVCT